MISNFINYVFPIGGLLFLLMNVPNMYETLLNREIGYFVYGAACDFITALILAVILKAVQSFNIIGILLKYIIVLWCSIMFLIISYSIVEGYPFEDIISIVLGTNISEVKEFYSSQFAYSSGIVILISFLLIVTLYKVIKKSISKVQINPQYICYLLGIMSILSFILILSKIDNTDWNGHAFLKKNSLLLRYESKPDLKFYYSDPSIKKTKSNNPNLVILIGESLSSDFCSLYGYNKETQPLLKTLVNNKRLFIFKDVVSPATSTLASFQQFMTTFVKKEDCNKPWFEHISLMEVLHISGYRMSWLSNQSKFGFFDNTINAFAECCDTSFFCGNIFDGTNKKTYDGELLKHISDFTSINQPHCFFIHFMGSHPVFKERYPESYEKFRYQDYDEKLPKNTRKSYAHRDNSILYNDYVVYNIMKQFNDNTIVIYFSDHGLDKDRHGSSNDPESFNNAIRIPFMLYLPDLVQQNNPELVNRIKKSQLGVQYSTTNLLYTIMDIIGYKFTSNNDVEKYSILNRNM